VRAARSRTRQSAGSDGIARIAGHLKTGEFVDTLIIHSEGPNVLCSSQPQRGVSQLAIIRQRTRALHPDG
jgi:hypothetical protein